MSQTMRFSVSTLIEKLKKNRENHLETYNKALAVYKEDFVAELTKMLKDAKADKKYTEHVNLNKPINKADVYDRIIKMLEFTSQETVELNENEFSNYVLDIWQWSDTVSMTNTSYANKFRG